MTDKRLLTEQQGRVVIVTFTNPPRNFFDLSPSLTFCEVTGLFRKTRMLLSSRLVSWTLLLMMRSSVTVCFSVLPGATFTWKR